MRFIIGFIFFGVLFYAIWYFFPETFATLAAWAGNVFEFLKNLLGGLIDKGAPQPSKEVVVESIPEAALYLLTIYPFCKK